MNYQIIVYIVGWILEICSVLMLVPAVTALVYHETAGFSFLITIIVCSIAGFVIIRRKPSKRAFYAREGLVTVALSWIVLSITGAIPFVLNGSIPNPVDAVFETVSGFTTTGASILADVESLPRCVLIWRSFSHWIGGMGVLVFILCLLPLTGGYQMNLMKAESPGPSVSRLVPKVRSTAIILYKIYMILTLLEIGFLLAGGMPMFETLCTAFGTAGTGGFGFLNDSFASFSSYIQIVVTVFMLLFGVNFNVYFLITIRKFRPALLVEELRYYALIILVATGLITWNVHHLFSGIGTALKHSAFQVATIITTTGFSTTDFDLWPGFSKTILVLLMFCGACAGSTGGGIKVSRLAILFKTVRKEIQIYLHPNAVKKIKMDDKMIPHEVIRATNIFMVVYIFIFCGSVLLVSLDNLDMTTNFTAVAATFNNIGPGLSQVGPSCNFGLLSPFAKIVLIFDMLAGRLEIFPILMLFVPSTWRKF
ncbi:MAG: TrkH family potassium uptake protein [Blautia sp.]|nr:TrkH family potassium uptake protein [Blautia sp.]